MRDAEHRWERRARASERLSRDSRRSRIWACGATQRAYDLLLQVHAMPLLIMRNMRTTDRPTFPLESYVKDFIVIIIKIRPLHWPCTLMASVLMQYIPLFRVVSQSAWCTVKCYNENIALSFHLIMCNVGCPMESLDMHGGVMCYATMTCKGFELPSKHLQMPATK